MKKLLLSLALLAGGVASAQNGLESIIVEKYYVSDANDAAGSVGTLPAGSVTYRFYVDMLPGYKFQAAFGTPAPAHTLSFTTTTSFFNNEDRGATTPTYTKTQARGNSIMLDSWISVGAAASGNYGVLKSEDDGVATVVNNSVPQMLQNADASAGIPLTTQDGLLLGTPSAVTTIGQTDGQLVVFDATSQEGNSFVLTDGAWSSLAGATGPTASNRVLIAQITTDGILSYSLNIQIGTPTGGVEQYVAADAVGSEITIPSLSGTLGAPNAAPTVSITSPNDGDSFIIGSTVNIAADANDTDGSISQVEFFVNGVSIGVDNASPYTASYPASAAGNFAITATATDDQGSTSSSLVNITVAANPAPNVSITSPSNGDGFITGDVVTINATATDNGSVTLVEFLVDGVVVGSDNTSPYSFDYTATLGNHTLRARATDDEGAIGLSTIVNISVLNNVPPTSQITSPAAGSLFTAPAVITITSNATDADGTVTQVEYFVNGVSIGVDATAPYSIDWTSTIGNASIVARSTDNRGASTNSSALNLSIADPNGLPYNLGTNNIANCLETTFCVPVIAFETVANVIGYDLVLNYDNTKVTPTGNITIAGDLVTPSQVDVINSIDAANGFMNISAFFNASAPSSARFAGTGELMCVEFVKTGSFTNTDTADFNVTFMQESYITGVQSKLVDDGAYVSFRDTLYPGKLTLWTDNSALPYDAADPNGSVITNIYGTDALCDNQSVDAVQPDLNGEFVYNTTNGLNISIQKDIINTTDVQAVINGADALLTRRVLLNDATYTPSAYEIISMDVNLDGVVSAGDVTQINQRAVLLIGEFQQAWNYDVNGVSNGEDSKDWLFIDSTSFSTDAIYTISATYPANDGLGYSKFNVPVVSFCLPVKVADFANCPSYNFINYVGVLVGDVNGNVATANPSSQFKSNTEKVIFNLVQAQIVENSVLVPVYFTSSSPVNTMDFSLAFNEEYLSFVSVESGFESADFLSHMNSTDRKIRYTSNSLSAMSSNRPAAFVKFNMFNGNLHASDLSDLFAYLNGNQAEVEVIGEMVTGLQEVNYADVVSVFPNPTKEFTQVMSPEDAVVTLMDASGRLVISPVTVNSGELKKLDTQNLSAGVYFIQVANNQFTVTKKLVIK